MDEGSVVRIARESVARREKWRRVDCAVNHTGTNWNVFVCRLPAKLIAPMVFMMVAEDGTVTHYERQMNLK